MGGRAPEARWRLVAAAAAAGAMGIACTSAEVPSSRATDSPGPSPAASTVVPGGLAGMEWPGGPVPVGALLFDDGERLWSVPLDGARELIWEHPRVGPVDIAASPDGRQLALSVFVPPEDPEDYDAARSVLYLLDDDGSVTTVDVLPGLSQVQEHPVFLRTPTLPDSLPRCTGCASSSPTTQPQGRSTLR